MCKDVGTSIKVRFAKQPMSVYGRDATLSLGCIQAMRCHTEHCLTGVATQNRWLIRGLDPNSKGNRLANYIVTLHRELPAVTRACGHPHPALLTLAHMEILNQQFSSTPLSEVFETQDYSDWGLPGAADRDEFQNIMMQTNAAA